MTRVSHAIARKHAEDVGFLREERARETTAACSSFLSRRKWPLDEGKLGIIEVISETDKDADENCSKWTLY